ncbi:hypothetical protein B296_00006570, partial [Ensete ventricosum]
VVDVSTTATVPFYSPDAARSTYADDRSHPNFPSVHLCDAAAASKVGERGGCRVCACGMYFRTDVYVARRGGRAFPRLQPSPLATPRLGPTDYPHLESAFLALHAEGGCQERDRSPDETLERRGDLSTSIRHVAKPQ